MIFSKLSTSKTFMVGPFVDATDGVTAETGLTIAQSDIRLSKNGAAFAQQNSATGGTHAENGFYAVTMNTTDTNTVGTLRMGIRIAGALPVWQDFLVLPANVYDSLVAGTDELVVDGADIADDVWDEDIVAAHGTADTAGLIASQLTKRSITFSSAVVQGSALRQLADDGTATFDRTTDSLQAVYDSSATIAQVVDATFDELTADHVIAGSTGAALGSIASGVSLAAGSITAAVIADNAIDAGSIATGAITAAKFAAGAITATVVADGTIDAATFAAGAITAAAIADGAIDAATFAAGAIDASAIAANAIGASEIGPDAITDIWQGTAITESYAADGSAATPAQLLYMIWSFLAEKNIVTTTLTAKKLDGSTTAMTFTLNDGTTPTAITRAS